MPDPDDHWSDWKDFCKSLGQQPPAEVKRLLCLFFDKSVSGNLPIKLIDVTREGTTAVRSMKLTYRLTIVEAMDIYKENKQIIDIHIRGLVCSGFGELSKQNEPIVTFKSVQAQQGSLDLIIDVISKALEIAPLVSAAAGTVNVGIGIWNLMRSLRNVNK